MALTGRAFPSRHVNPTWVFAPPPPPGEVGLATGVGAVLSVVPQTVAYAGVAVGVAVVFAVTGPQSVVTATAGIALGTARFQGQNARTPRLIAFGTAVVFAPSVIVAPVAGAAAGVGSMLAPAVNVVAQAGPITGVGVVPHVDVPGADMAWVSGETLQWVSGEPINWAT